MIDGMWILLFVLAIMVIALVITVVIQAVVLRHLSKNNPQNHKGTQSQ